MRGGSILPVVTAALVPLLLFVIIVVASSLGAVAWKPPVLWSDRFGTPQGSNGITSVAVDNFGRYVCGYLNETDGTPGTPFIREYDLNGGDVWTRTLASTPSSDIFPLLSGISVSTVGILVVGDLNDNITVMMYDLKGNQLWSRDIARDAGGDAVYTTPTSIYVAGVASGLLSNETYAVLTPFLREYDTFGNIVWTQKLSNSPGNVYALYVDSSEVLILTNNSLLKYDLNGNHLWTIPAAGNGLSADSTGSYVSGGSLTKYNSDGSMAWSLMLHAPDTVIDSSLVSSDSSGVYVSLSDNMGREYVMKYDSSGNQIWTAQIEPLPANLLTYRRGYIITVISGNTYLAGSTIENGSTYAFVGELADSSSLVFFGINPPWSFLMVTTFSIVAVAFSFLLVRRQEAKVKRNAKRFTRTHGSGS
jgi:hypothetical protein